MTQENLTVAEALRCYTSRGAYAMFMEDEIGKISPGYRADFIVVHELLFGTCSEVGEHSAGECLRRGQACLRNPLARLRRYIRVGLGPKRLCTTAFAHCIAGLDR